MAERHVGITHMRRLTTLALAAEKDVLIFHHHLEPLAVMVPYEVYVKWQTAHDELEKRIDALPHGAHEI